MYELQPAHSPCPAWCSRSLCEAPSPSPPTPCLCLRWVASCAKVHRLVGLPAAAHWCGAPWPGTLLLLVPAGWGHHARAIVCPAACTRMGACLQLRTGVPHLPKAPVCWCTQWAATLHKLQCASNYAVAQLEASKPGTSRERAGELSMVARNWLFSLHQRCVVSLASLC